MNKKEFVKKLNDFGWQEVKKITKGMKGTTKIINKKEFKYIKIPSINI